MRPFQGGSAGDCERAKAVFPKFTCEVVVLKGQRVGATGFPRYRVPGERALRQGQEGWYRAGEASVP